MHFAAFLTLIPALTIATSGNKLEVRSRVPGTISAASSSSSAVGRVPKSISISSSSIVARSAKTINTATPTANLLGAAKPSSKPLVLVYKGQASQCDQGSCADDAFSLAQEALPDHQVEYVGPFAPKAEYQNVNASLINQSVLWIQPGGGDFNSTNIDDVKPFASAMQAYISNGGRYLGICLGGYLAHREAFNILPNGIDSSQEEINQDGSSVDTADDTTIEVRWEYANKTSQIRHPFFSDGGAILGNITAYPHAQVKAKYLPNEDIAAAIIPSGRGWVAITGPHVEATQIWYDEDDMSSPDYDDTSEIKRVEGVDLIKSLMAAGETNDEVIVTDSVVFTSTAVSPGANTTGSIGNSASSKTPHQVILLVSILMGVISALQ